MTLLAQGVGAKNPGRVARISFSES